MGNSKQALWPQVNTYGRRQCPGCKAVREKGQSLPLAVDPYRLAQSA